MKKKIQPIINNVMVNCSCGHTFNIATTLLVPQLNVDICNVCHPFYSGKQKIIDTEKRVEFFRKRFSSI